jgi:AraC-like DNA-binding protein
MSADLIPLSKVSRTRMRELGIDQGRVLELAGIPPGLFLSARPRLSTEQFFAFWQAIGTVGVDPMIGLRLGEHTSAEHVEVISMAALHSANFLDAMRKVARYKRLLCPEEITLEEQSPHCVVHYRWTATENHAPATLTDAMFASALGLVRRGTGDETIVPHRIEFIRRAPDGVVAKMYAEYFGCPVLFGAARDLLIWDSATLLRPFITHNEDLVDILLPGLEAALREHASSQSLVEQVGSLLGRGMRGQRPSVDTVAKQLHMSARTLQRRLADEGVSYQQLLDRVRQQAARHLLTATNLEAGEIAFFLGFEELNSFTRAFNHWEGMSPNRWRDEARSVSH